MLIIAIRIIIVRKLTLHHLAPGVHGVQYRLPLLPLSLLLLLLLPPQISSLAFPLQKFKPQTHLLWMIRNPLEEESLEEFILKINSTLIIRLMFRACLFVNNEHSNDISISLFDDSNWDIRWSFVATSILTSYTD